jgi:hypothetical protein
LSFRCLLDCCDHVGEVITSHFGTPLSRGEPFPRWTMQPYPLVLVPDNSAVRTSYKKTAWLTGCRASQTVGHLAVAVRSDGANALFNTSILFSARATVRTPCELLHFLLYWEQTDGQDIRRRCIGEIRAITA